jgi:hypothetical protein
MVYDALSKLSEEFEVEDVNFEMLYEGSNDHPHPVLFIPNFRKRDPAAPVPAFVKDKTPYRHPWMMLRCHQAIPIFLQGVCMQITGSPHALALEFGPNVEGLTAGRVAYRNRAARYVAKIMQERGVHITDPARSRYFQGVLALLIKLIGMEAGDDLATAF